MELVWHYTTRCDDHLGSILRDRSIRIESVERLRSQGVHLPATSLMGLAAWFSANQEWEPTAQKRRDDGKLIAKAEMLAMSARIGVERSLPGLLNWNEYQIRVPVIEKYTKRKREQFREMCRKLGVVAIRSGGDPTKFYASLSPVPASAWMAIQIHDGTGWIDVPTRTSQGE